MTLRLVVVPTAQRLIRTASRWWRENRSAAPDLLADELETAFAVITSQPKIGMHAPEAEEENVRRLHLRRTDYYLYYRHSDDLIEVLALWHASGVAAHLLFDQSPEVKAEVQH